jgi:hypothetical protein
MTEELKDAEREAFEAWATEEGWWNFTRINKGYAVDHLDDAWQSWQASRRAALTSVPNHCTNCGMNVDPKCACSRGRAALAAGAKP